MSESPKKRLHWIPWAVGAGVLLSAILVGWLGFQGVIHLLSEAWGSSTTFAKVIQMDEAAVAPAQGEIQVSTGGQVELAWEITNAGKSVWTPEAYQFEAADPAIPAIPLPGRVEPHGVVTLRTTVFAPVRPGRWYPEWNLTGPQGSVHGGKLTGAVRVEAEP